MTTQKKRNIFSFSDDEDEDDIFINSVKPLPSNAVERSAFTAAKFDPDTFLSSRRHLSLERMKSELNTHLTSLKAELVELINRDYQDFINLSTNLKGVDKDIQDLKSPLTDMEVQVKGVRDHFQDVTNSLEAQLESRAHLRNKKATLKLLLHINDSVTKVEDLLDINADVVKPTSIALNGETNTGDDSLGKQIERVAIEYNQMQYLVRKGKDLAYVTENEWRITRIKDTLEQKLSKALSIALSQIRRGEVTRATKQSLTQCLRTYALIDQTQTAERIIREEFIRPFLTKIITQKAVEGARNYGSPTGTDETKHPLFIMYTKILTFVSTDLQPILDITQKTLKGSNYDILVNSLWLEATERINKECKSIFAAGQTDVFHKNYSATVSFISGLEGLCYSKRSLLYLRNHPTYNEFMKRWQLQVYFQLRFREIIKNVEAILNEPSESLSLNNADFTKEIILPGGEVILAAIKKCWSDQMFLYGLSHRFWRLTLQLILRYSGWSSDIANNPANVSKDAEYPKLLAILEHDINNFVKIVKVQMNEIMLPKLPANVQDLPSLKESMNEVLEQLTGLAVPKINSSITNSIAAECAETLKLVKSITSHYRHTNKEAPKETSYFIPNLLKPLHHFIEQNQGWTDQEVQVSWAHVVVKNVVLQYTTTVEDLLSSIKKTEESMSKLNKKKSSTGNGLSDDDKIRLQIYLDVQQLGLELKTFNIETSQNYYKKLCTLVEPFGK
ncbi:hypothetical protein HPULCUR_006468 [Helicostylum pulchrum]|uniref:Conserved oligomeric Golgi complex subunit 2 n=1 Tax=Helicostylum pulchrum TaxID=562976 RepID=A0ABP9Y281_9FUNG